MPSGQMNEQYTLPKSSVMTISNMNAIIDPLIIEISAGVNCILSNVSETGFPPLILRKPHVAMTNIIDAQTILVILSIFPIVLKFDAKLLLLKIIWDQVLKK